MQRFSPRRRPGRPARHAAATLIAAALAVSLAGCATQLGNATVTTGSVTPAAEPAAPVRKEEKVVRVALILPFGQPGQTAVIAKSMKQAGELALFDRDDAQFQLLAFDDKGTPEGARAAADQAVKDGAEFILGPLYSQSVSAAAAVARQARLPVIAFSNDRTAAGNGVYLISFLAETEVERVVSYAAAQGKRRFAAIVSDDPYGRVTEDSFKSAVGRAGGTVVVTERYPVQANGMVEPARRLGDQLREAEAGGQPIDALFIPGGSEVLQSLGPLLTYAGLNPQQVKILGTGGMDHPNIGKDPLFRGAWFASPDPRGWQDFQARFSKTFGSVPPRIATLAYDAVTAAVALARDPGNIRYTTPQFMRPSGFQGVDGTVRFTPAGTAARDLAILEVQEIGTPIVVDAGGSALPSGPQAAATTGRVN